MSKMGKYTEPWPVCLHQTLHHSSAQISVEMVLKHPSNSCPENPVSLCAVGRTLFQVSLPKTDKQRSSITCAETNQYQTLSKLLNLSFDCLCTCTSYTPLVHDSMIFFFLTGCILNVRLLKSKGVVMVFLNTVIYWITYIS